MALKELITTIAQALVDDPDSVEVTEELRAKAHLLHNFGGTPIGNSRVKLTNVADFVKRGLVKDITAAVVKNFGAPGAAGGYNRRRPSQVREVFP